MDREQEEMKSLGFFGIYKEASKIILSWKRIFTQITLTLILPLSLLILVHTEVSNLLYSKIQHKSKEMHAINPNTTQYHKLHDTVNSEWHISVLYQCALFIFLLLLSLPSTSAVVYSIASIYTAKDVTFKRVMSVVPKVLVRLLWTFFAAFILFLFYNLVISIFELVIYLLIASFGDGRNGGVGISLLALLVVLNLSGFVYITVVWQLASVVTVLEDFSGFGAIGKSLVLMKGKKVFSIFILFTLVVSLVSIMILFEEMVVKRWSVSPVEGAALGVLCFFLLPCLFLFWLVVQTVLYFVWKSYHNENIDKSALANRLEGYRGSRRVSANESHDVQPEQNQV